MYGNFPTEVYTGTSRKLGKLLGVLSDDEGDSLDIYNEAGIKSQWIFREVQTTIVQWWG